MKTSRNMDRPRVPVCIAALALLCFGLVGSKAQELINADAGPGTKTGAAVIGSSGDYWNTFNNNPNMTNGVLVPLYNSGNTNTGAGLLMYNMDGQGSFSWGDTMFDSYIQSDNTNLMSFITNVSMGVYDLYLYGHGPNDADISIFNVHSAVTSYGEKQTSSEYEWNDGSQTFAEGDQYVKYSDVAIPLGASMRIDVLTNSGGKAFINGLQLISKATPSGDWDSDGRDNATEIAAGTDPKSSDTDGDGKSDGAEHTAGTDPLDPSDLTFARLVYWSFDDAGTWAGDNSQTPVTVQNVSGVTGYSNGGIEIDSQSGAVDKLIYNRVESGAAHNAASHNGSFRFRFKPSWSTSGGGPGSIARLIDMGGTASSGTNDGSWTLYVTADGASVKFVTRDLDDKREHFSATISWSSGTWYEVNLDYTPTNSSLHVDSVLKATGTGVTGIVPMGQLSIGSDGSDGPAGTVTWVDDPCFSDPNTLWEWDDDLQDYVAGYFTGGTWVEDPCLTHPDTYFRDAYDYCWNSIISEDGYWQGSSTGDNNSARGVLDELEIFNYPLNSGSILPAVVFSPASGGEVPVNVTLSVPNHPSATIYYTTDGSAPTTSSTVYSSAIAVNSPATVKAIASETGFGNSPVVSATYVLPTVPNVVATPGAGTFVPANVTLSVPGHGGATIYFTTNGSTPTTSSAVYTSPISLAESSASWSTNLIPPMPGPTFEDHTVTASSSISSHYAPWRAFSGDTNSSWRAASSGPEQLVFEFPEARGVARYRISSRESDGPKEWTFEGWNGSSWVILDTRSGQTDWSLGETREYPITSGGSYTQYRLNVTAGNVSVANPNAFITIGDLEMEERRIYVKTFATEADHNDSAVSELLYHADAPPVAPQILVQPEAVGAPNGSDITLGVVATGTSPLTYQWYLDGNAIPGETGSTIQLTNLDESGGDPFGSYSATVVNSNGNAGSSVAQVSYDMVSPDPDSSWGGPASLVFYSYADTSCPGGAYITPKPRCNTAPASNCGGGSCALANQQNIKYPPSVFPPPGSENIPQSMPATYSNTGFTVPPGASAIGANTFDVASGSAFREITDIALHAGVGKHRLAFIRNHSTMVNNITPVLGDGGSWRHNYQWDMEYYWDGVTCGGGVFSVQVPDGEQFQFTLNELLMEVEAEMGGDPTFEEVVNHAYTTTNAYTDEAGKKYLKFEVSDYFTGLYSGNPDFEARSYDYTNVVLVFPTGWKYEFYFPIGMTNDAPDRAAFRQFSDPHFHVYPVELNSYLQPTNIGEPAGRWLSFSYNTNRHIDRVGTSDGRYVTYTYHGIPRPTGSIVDQLLVTVDYQNGNPRARYQYYLGSGNQYLLGIMDDPKLTGTGAHIQYIYGDANGVGGVVGEINPVSGQILTKIADVDHQGSGSDYYLVVNGAGVTNVFQWTEDDVDSVLDANYVAKETYSRLSPIHVEESDKNYYTVTDALGRKTVNVLDKNNVLLELTKLDDQGNVLHQEGWLRDTNGFVLAHTNALGAVTTYTRNTNRLVTRIDYADGGWQGFGYNNFCQVAFHTNRLGGVTEHQYDSTGLLTNTINPLGFGKTYTYDTHERTATITDARTNTITYGYDTAERRNTVTLPDGSVTGQTFDKYGNRIFRTNELGKIWSWTYNELNQQTTATDPLNRTTTMSYVLNGNCCGGGAGFNDSPTSIVSPEGRETRIEYDDDGRQTAIILAYGTSSAATNRFEYDFLGRMTNSIDALGNATSTAYDLLDRPVSRTDALLNTSYTYYDVVGNVLGTKRPDNLTTTNYFDVMGRQTNTVDVAGNTNSFTYGVAGNLLSLTDARGATHSYQYDSLGQKLVMTYPGGSTEQWDYNEVGLVESYTNRAGNVRTTSYDNRNRPTNTVWDDGLTPVITRSYDAAGRLSTLNSSVSELTYTYDDANQLLSETQDAVGQSARTIAYTYHDDGQRHTVTYPNGTVVTNAYNELGLLTSITRDGETNALASYLYDKLGRRTQRVYKNGTVSVYSYNASHQTTLMEHTNSSGIFASFEYGYNALGLRLWEKREDNLGDAYLYDALGQVTNVLYDATDVDTMPSLAVRDVSYAYDANGNRNSVTDEANVDTYSANLLNQYTNITWASLGNDLPTYDGNGNLTSAHGTVNTYDAQNRLLTAETGTNRMVFDYDSKNRCVRRRVYTHDGMVWSFSHEYYLYYDNWNLIEERANDGSEICEYIHGPKIDEILVRTDVAGDVYRYENALGNVSHLASNTGAVVEKYEYDVFGAATIKSGGGATLTASAYLNRFLFTGREWLATVGLYDYRNRIYSVVVGIFLQTDPVGFAAGDINLYRYVFNAVTSYVDPDGKAIIPIIPVLILMIGALAIELGVRLYCECQFQEGQHAYIRTPVTMMFPFSGIGMVYIILSCDGPGTVRLHLWKDSGGNCHAEYVLFCDGGGTSA